MRPLTRVFIYCANLNLISVSTVSLTAGSGLPRSKVQPTGGFTVNSVNTKMSESSKKAQFEAAVSGIMDRLYGAAMRYTRNPVNAEDLMADTLVKAWSNIESLNDFDRFESWITRILSNTYISQWRRQKTSEGIFDDDHCPDDLDDSHSLYARLHQPFLLWWGTPEKTFVNDLLARDIERAMDSIPEVYRIVVIMVEVLGHTYEEASDSLEVPIGTVRSRLSRGRRLLQDALWKNAKDSGIN